LGVCDGGHRLIVMKKRQVKMGHLAGGQAQVDTRLVFLQF
jgi:hypothetical protein